MSHKFKSKSGRKIQLVTPTLGKASEFTAFINRLVDEDTFLTFTSGDRKTVEQEKNWIEKNLADMRLKQGFYIWALHEGKIVGTCDVWCGPTARDRHTGKVGLMIDKNFRNDGIGQFLLEFITEKAKELKLKILKLDVFSDNHAALKLYDKLGFKEFGRLPNGLFRQGKFSDEIKMYKEL